MDSPNDGVLLLRSPLHTNRILITNPKALADVLVANPYDFQKPKKIRAFLRKVLGDGLIMVEGDQHRFQRKNLMPAFSFRHIKELYPMMWQKAKILTERLSAEMKEGNNVFEINSWAGKVTLDIIGVAGLGREFNTMYDSEDQIVKNYEELLEPTAQKLVYFLLHAFTSATFVQMLPWKLNKIFQDTTSSLKSICWDLVKSKRELIQSGIDENFDILSLLIKSNNFSDEELVDQLLTFLVAG
jgi:cytochrome P450